MSDDTTTAPPAIESPYPLQYTKAGPPGYPDVTVWICENLTNAEYLDLTTTFLDGGEQQARLLALLVKCYRGRRYTAYGLALDFTTPAAALSTLQNPELPEPLRAWLRNAPIKVVDRACDQLTFDWRASFRPSAPNK